MPPVKNTNPKFISKDQVNVIIKNGQAKGLTGKAVLDGLIERGYQPEGIDVNAAKQSIAADKAKTAAIPAQQSTGQETLDDVKQTGSEIVNNAKQRVANIKEISNKVDQGMNPIEAGFQTAGQVASGISEGIGSILKGGIKVVLNDKHEKAVKDLIGKFGAKIMAVPAVQAVVNEYHSLTPEQQKNIDAAGGLISVVADLTGLDEAGQAVKGGVKAGIEGVGDVAKSASGALDSAGKEIGAATSKITGELIPTTDRIVNHQVTRALDLTDGDVKNISQSTGNEVGQFLADKNLIGGNKDETIKMIHDFYTKNYDDVRAEIAKVTTKYSPASVPRYTEALKQIKNVIDGVPGMQEASVEVDNLLNKGLKGQKITLNDVQRTKELLDEHFNLYKVTGDVKEGAAKEGLSTIRGDLKNFIEKEVKKNTGTDIAQLNNNVQTARSIEDAVDVRSTRGLATSNIKLGDLGVFGVGSTLGSPFLGVAAVFAKKIIESPSIRLKIAKFLDAISDARKLRIQSELEKGVIPTEIKTIIDAPKTGGKISEIIDAAKTNLKDKAKSQGGFISLGGTQEGSEALPKTAQKVVSSPKSSTAGVAKSVIKSMHPEDISLMQKFIDFARTGSDLSDDEFSLIEKLAQKFKIPMDKGLKGVADEFENVLTGKKKS